MDIMPVCWFGIEEESSSAMLLSFFVISTGHFVDSTDLVCRSVTDDGKTGDAGVSSLSRGRELRFELMRGGIEIAVLFL